ncbi:hypothetical protein [Micromonospora coriariae]|nr:hypothetical protein [Micromonospora coriariae]
MPDGTEAWPAGRELREAGSGQRVKPPRHARRMALTADHTSV